MVEYALLAALMAVACISSVNAMRSRISCRFQAINDAVRSTPMPSLYLTACGASAPPEGEGGDDESGGGGG